jgi:hypothetical protein
MSDVSPARRPRSPGSLGADGRTLWRAVTGAYELSPAETAVLGRCCRTLDVLARVDAALIEADDLTVEGSVGQLKPHPLLAVKAEQERVLDALLRSLALPMPSEVEGRRRSPSAVAAAQARWRAQRG